ncbi:hypothetical protein B296_00008355, partial [Ensete ventricosum]
SPSKASIPAYDSPSRSAVATILHLSRFLELRWSQQWRVFYEVRRLWIPEFLTSKALDVSPKEPPNPSGDDSEGTRLEDADPSTRHSRAHISPPSSPANSTVTVFFFFLFLGYWFGLFYNWTVLVLGFFQEIRQDEISILKIFKGANSIIPHVVLASTVLALVYPPSFTWFTTRSCIIFLCFILDLGAGIMLVSCVSGAQLSNYATFLTDPPMAPLSIVMTSLSTATAVFVTPTLSLLLIGQKLPVDVKGMMSSIVQIVVAPIAAGLFLNRYHA